MLDVGILSEIWADIVKRPYITVGMAAFLLMIPLAIPLATGLDMNMALIIGAVLGGGIFGDHCSPLSDTTIVASMAAACDHIDHVNTQLPYAVLGAIVAVILYLGFGFVLLS